MHFPSPGSKQARAARRRRAQELLAKYPGKTYWEAVKLDAEELQANVKEWAHKLKEGKENQK